MNNFEIPTPRATIGIAAIAMTTLTLSLLVVLPSKMERESETFMMLATPKALGPGATEPIIAPVCIELAGAHDPKTAFHRGHNMPPSGRSATIL
jgi:hypothetical protein